MPGPLLATINSPSDLRLLKKDQLPQLCKEIRQYIIDVTSHNPGHLGASLGTVELTVAIHYVFATPEDKLIWDVGHQAYAHKILTGRAEAFKKNRMKDGISGFPKMSESEYDAFGTGHSSTSLSALLGMAIASKLDQNNKRQHIAVIGDGSMTAGMAFEALNHAGSTNANILVVLNDNGIAIDKNTGAFSDILTRIVASNKYNSFKNKVWNLLGGKKHQHNQTRAFIRKFGYLLKSTLLKKSNYFETFNFRYFGTVDGHDVIRLIKILNDLKKISGPKILHCITVKGKGFEKAEKDQTMYHSPGMFNKTTGEIIEKPCVGKISPKYQTVFGRTMIELAEMNPKVVGITPAMLTGCSLDLMMQKMPDRVFDVGIAEQHAVTFAAGMAANGYIPFCNIYSSFMQRSYDQIIHDVALQKLKVILVLDRAGLVGEDGPTHHGAFDLAYMRSIPNMIVSAPMNEQELRNMMFTAQSTNNQLPFSIRYPRGRGVMHEWKTPFENIPIGKGRKLRDGNDIAIISIGHPGNFVIQAAAILYKENINIAMYDMRFLKPIDEELLHEALSSFKTIITIEDGTIMGGLGSAIQEFASNNKYQVNIHKLGIPDNFVEQGTPEELYAICGYDVQGIINAVKDLQKVFLL